MFDPTALSVRARIVPLWNGMYMFQGAYKGEAEFFSGRTMQRPIWAEDSDVTEASAVRSETSETLEAVHGWPTLESPPELELEPGDHQKPGSFS